MQQSFREFSAEFLRKRRQRQSYADLWIEAESKWCEEANPFGLDMEEEETVPSQEESWVNDDRKASKFGLQSGRTRADLRVEIQAGRSLLQTRVRELEERASEQKPAPSAAHSLKVQPFQQESTCHLKFEDRISEMKRQWEVTHQRFMANIDRISSIGSDVCQQRRTIGSIGSDIRQQRRDCDASSNVSELLKNLQSKYSRDNESSRSVAEVVQAKVQKEVVTRPAFHTRVRSASPPALLKSRIALLAESTKDLLAKRDEQRARLERLMQGSPKKVTSCNLPTLLGNSAVHSRTLILPLLHGS